MKKIIMIFLIIFSNYIIAQKTSLFIAGREFKLNMDKEEVLRMLPNVTDSNQVGFDININGNFYGQVFFNEKNKLKYISKEWIINQKIKNTIETMTILYTVLKQAFDNENYSKLVELSLQEFNDPEPKYCGKLIHITLDKDWEIELGIYNTNIQIKEIIGTLPKYEGK